MSRSKETAKDFPKIMFQLDEKEKNEVVANCDHLSRLRFSSNLPYAFTEHGAVMLASVLNSERAIEVNIQVVKVFVQLREAMLDNINWKLEIEDIKRKLQNHGKSLGIVFNCLDQLLEKKSEP